MKVIGTVGDVNPIDHDGGFILDREEGSGWEIFFYQNADEEDEDSDIIRYIVQLTAKDDDWINLKNVAESVGLTKRDLRALRDSEDPLVQADFLMAVAGYYGWEELDNYSQQMMREEATSEVDEYANLLAEHRAAKP